MTPCEVLAKVRGLGYRLGLRPGGLQLTGTGEPSSDVVALIQEHRAGLVEYLEADAKAWEAFEAGIAAGRVVPFPVHLLDMVHPSIQHLLKGDPKPCARVANGHRV